MPLLRTCKDETCGKPFRPTSRRGKFCAECLDRRGEIFLQKRLEQMRIRAAERKKRKDNELVS
jgi:hypothetical protein